MSTITGAPARAYHLSPEQIKSFDEHGYLVLRQLLAPELVERLRQAADRWIAAGSENPDHPDYLFADRPTGRVMWRVDYLHNKKEAASLELLGCPEVLGVAESLAGPDFVPTYEALVFKHEGDGVAVPWHQDAVHPRRHRIFNVDVYLDPSRSGEGALRVVPGSHRSKADVCAIEEGFGWEVPNSTVVEMEPGDVLLHDVMLVHGSEPVVGNRLRRTIYYEFRPARQILSEGPWDAEWIDARLRLVPVALRAFHDRYPGRTGFGWNPPEALRPEPAGDTETELRVAHRVHTPGSYCSAGDVPAAE
ncbi:phytanoyl-CoA dioxygenase family protein [Streptomyces sp. NPDC005496]|uniref:phytanoyl-CoA dioxygenase family protein n=1 Tax=unclassified Streptomyces TaxID=2593676 RepID=UPI0033A41303